MVTKIKAIFDTIEKKIGPKKLDKKTRAMLMELENILLNTVLGLDEAYYYDEDCREMVISAYTVNTIKSKFK